MDASQLGASPTTVSIRRSTIALLATAVVVALIVVGLLAHSAGKREGGRTTTLTGDFFVGAVGNASARVGDWSYGIDGNVEWIDTRDVSHDGSWPACLTPQRRVRVRFGTVPVEDPLGVGSRPVVWVDCRGATTVR